MDCHLVVWCPRASYSTVVSPSVKVTIILSISGDYPTQGMKSVWQIENVQYILVAAMMSSIPSFIIYAGPVPRWCVYGLLTEPVLLWAARDCIGCLGCHFDLVCVYSQQKLIHTLDLSSVTIGSKAPLRKDLEPKKKETLHVNTWTWIFTKADSTRRGTSWNGLPWQSGGGFGFYIPGKKLWETGLCKDPKFTAERKHLE